MSTLTQRAATASYSPSPDSPAPRTSPRAVALASLIGSTIEWFDFSLYGTASALVFNKLYFPTFDPRMGTLAAFGTNAVAFVARPVGAAVCGHFGDRIGRKSMLVATLMTMGIATFCIGLMPTYATIGPFGAIGLVTLRFIQGLGVGGEWGGAALMIVEHVPANRRGFYASWSEIGVPAGVALAMTVYTLFARLPEAQFLAWGWRVPFLFSIVLVLVGLLIRLRIADSPVFARVKAQRAEARVPLLEVLRHHRRTLLLAIGMRIGPNATFYVYTVFMIVYGTTVVHVARQTVLDGVLVGALCMAIGVPIFGALTDRVGRRPVFLFGASMAALLAYPMFILFDRGTSASIKLALACIMSVQSAITAPQPSFYAEQFRARVRYTGASLGVQLAAPLGGGLSPFIAAMLLPYGRGAIALYMIATLAITIVSVLIAPETRGRSLED